MFPLSLTIPGKGQFRKLLEPDQTYSGRPVYNHTETGEIIFFRGESSFWRNKLTLGIVDNIWRLCAGCDYKDSSSDIGTIKSLSTSLMIPRLTFQEWEGLESAAGWTF